MLLTIFSFTFLCSYFVDLPPQMADSPSATTGPNGKKELELLQGISGAFRPETLTALMGVTGAGKTTLMDVLAGRKTGLLASLDRLARKLLASWLCPPSCMQNPLQAVCSDGLYLLGLFEEALIDLHLNYAGAKWLRGLSRRPYYGRYPTEWVSKRAGQLCSRLRLCRAGQMLSSRRSQKLSTIRITSFLAPLLSQRRPILLLVYLRPA